MDALWKLHFPDACVNGCVGFCALLGRQDTGVAQLQTIAARTGLPPGYSRGRCGPLTMSFKMLRKITCPPGDSPARANCCLTKTPNRDHHHLGRTKTDGSDDGWLLSIVESRWRNDACHFMEMCVALTKHRDWIVPAWVLAEHRSS